MNDFIQWDRLLAGLVVSGLLLGAIYRYARAFAACRSRTPVEPVGRQKWIESIGRPATLRYWVAFSIAAVGLVGSPTSYSQMMNSILGIGSLLIMVVAVVRAIRDPEETFMVAFAITSVPYTAVAYLVYMIDWGSERSFVWLVCTLPAVLFALHRDSRSARDYTKLNNAA